MKKKVTITLTRAEANAVINGLESVLHGNYGLDGKRRKLAHGVIDRILGEPGYWENDSVRFA